MKETQYTELPRFDSGRFAQCKTFNLSVTNLFFFFAEMLSEDGPGVGWRDPSELDRMKEQTNRMRHRASRSLPCPA